MSPQRFLELVVASGLVSQERLDRAIDSFYSSEDGEIDVHALPRLAEWLIRVGVVTPWQCGKLLEGRYKGFFLGKYRLLTHLANGKASSRYLAENGDTREQVEIIVTARSKATAFFVITPGSLLDEDDDR